RHTRFSRDWSSDVCSSDLSLHRVIEHPNFSLCSRKMHGMDSSGCTANAIYRYRMMLDSAGARSDTLLLRTCGKAGKRPRLEGARSEERRVGTERTYWWQE